MPVILFSAYERGIPNEKSSIQRLALYIVYIILYPAGGEFLVGGRLHHFS